MEPLACQQELSITRLLQAAFDSTEIVRFIVDQHGCVMHFNRKAYENSILIHDRELKKGDNLFAFASETSNKVQNHLRLQLDRALTGETFVIESEVKQDNGSRWYETEYIPLLNDRKMVGVSISTSDITDRKQKERQQHELIAELKATSQNRLQQIDLSLENTIHKFQQAVAGPENEQISRTILEKFFKEISSLRKKIHPWHRKK